MFFSLPLLIDFSFTNRLLNAFLQTISFPSFFLSLSLFTNSQFLDTSILFSLISFFSSPSLSLSNKLMGMRSFSLFSSSSHSSLSLFLSSSSSSSLSRSKMCCDQNTSSQTHFLLSFFLRTFFLF